MMSVTEKTATLFRAQRFFPAETDLPCLSTSSTLTILRRLPENVRYLAILSLAICEICSRPSVPGRISTKRAEIDDFLDGAAVNLADRRFLR
jgi:hypothetical protein